MAAQQNPTISFSLNFEQKHHRFDGYTFTFRIDVAAPTLAQAVTGINPNPRMVQVDVTGLIDQPRQRCPLTTVFVELPALVVDQDDHKELQLRGDFGFAGLSLHQWECDWSYMASIFALGAAHVDQNISDNDQGSIVERARRRYMVAATRAAFMHVINWNVELYDTIQMQCWNPRNTDGIFAPERMLQSVFEAGTVPVCYQTSRYWGFEEMEQMEE